MSHLLLSLRQLICIQLYDCLSLNLYSGARIIELAQHLQSVTPARHTAGSCATIGVVTDRLSHESAVVSVMSSRESSMYGMQLNTKPMLSSAFKLKDTGANLILNLHC